MNLVIIGINHKKAPLEVREKFSFSLESLKEQYLCLKGCAEVDEAFILSTCNRVELYGVGPDPSALAFRLQEFLCRTHGMPPQYFENYFYRKSGLDAFAHLFNVAAGLDSMVIGEPQIMGQIRKAYDAAASAGTVGPYLHKALQDALRIGKKVRSLTSISRGVTSVSGVAVELVKQEPDLKDKNVLVIGAGKVGVMTVEKLAVLPVRQITVTNRGMARAQELNKNRSVRVIPIRRLKQELANADIVIAATAAPGYILDRGLIKEALKTGKNKLLLIDLGVPRNIDEKARTLENVRLYNIDDLAPVIQETIRNRTLEAEKARGMILTELELMRQRNMKNSAVPEPCAQSSSV